MGGAIGVESTFGEGSSFWFTARFSRQAAAASALHRRVVPATLRGLRVLVVDDNATAREILRGMLERFDWQVAVAASGEAALQSLSQPYDFMLIDWKMPGLNGIETVAQIKARHPTPMPKFILVGAYGHEEVLKQAQLAQCEGFLVKPVSASVLLDTVMEALGEVVTKRRARDLLRGKHPTGFEAVRGARLLLVEDNEVNRQVAVELLSQEGFWVTVAGDGRIAVEMIREAAADAFDLVLMDLQMPEMDGYTATQEIRRMGSGVPIVAMTADAVSGVAERCRAVGMNDYVAKPIDPQELFAALTCWIPPGHRQLNPSASAEAVSAETALPDLPGLDTADGLARVGGNRAAYAKLLLKFAHNNASAVTDIRAALQQGDEERAVRLAHTLKGVSGNIGAQTLRSVFSDLETALKEKQSALEPLLAACQQELQQVVRAIAALETVPEASAAPTSVDMAALTPRLAELRRLLKDSDMDASEVVSALLVHVKGTALAKPLQAIETALEQYDFKRALELLSSSEGQFQN